MVAEGYRARVAPYVDRMVGPFLRWAPDRLTWTALLLSAIAAVLSIAVRWTTVLLFLPVAFLILFSGVFDVLDGEVARRTGRASARGDLFDHVADRYADVLIVAGVGLSGYANPVLALLALVSLLLTSYMGTQAQALGLGRQYAGLLSRADRLVILASVTFLEFNLSLPWPWAPTAPLSRIHLYGWTFTVLDLAFLYFVIAGQYTALARARATYLALPPSR
ncbi:MAG: CDP-alcohol phosphatidyltransferase family protein [Thermoplasmata archaeon]|nr:CDP-alcohol phosphatidyltransferase family protein [Thermoplasmata archaeon]